MPNIDTTFLRNAFDRYLARFETGTLVPTDYYLSYDFDREICQYWWDPMRMHLVVNELQELTNILNDWQSMLWSWRAWNQVLTTYSEKEAWGLQKEFSEPLARTCLLKPSSVRDTFTFVATNAMHQVQLALDTGRKDYLDGDPVSSGKKPRYLNRTQKEHRLANLVSPWPEGADFIAALQKIDDKEYRKESLDYRNRSSHAIGPRLGVGHTQLVTREVVQAIEMKRLDDGTYEERTIPGKMAVSYAFGGIPPLDMEQARTINLDQYLRARVTYNHYRTLLSAGMSKLPKKAC